MKDLTCLAEGQVFSTDFKETGINQNEIVVGATGGGKTFSTAYPRLLHTYHSSVVVPISKAALKEDFARLFKERGYKVIDLNFAEPDKSEYGYNPLLFCRTDEDVHHLACVILEAAEKREKASDQYWVNAARNVLAAEIHLIMMNAKYQNKEPNIADVVLLHKNIKTLPRENVCINLTRFFDEADKRFPEFNAKQLWMSVANLPPRTAQCVLSYVSTGLNNTFSNSVVGMAHRGKLVDFAQLGRKKTALFITTSPVNVTGDAVVNLMYGDMIRELFAEAEHNKEHRLKVPVHMICDDFACSGKIKDFERFISIFRAAGISATILLQSESQLYAMYGEAGATTIIDNCDTYVYMGGMDLKTCENVSRRVNRTLDSVLSMPLEQVIVFRRGNNPVMARRYQTLEDSVYRENIG
jgi:type IV secretion system protein VirD4